VSRARPQSGRHRGRSAGVQLRAVRTNDCRARNGRPATSGLAKRWCAPRAGVSPCTSTNPSRSPSVRLPHQPFLRMQGPAAHHRHQFQFHNAIVSLAVVQLSSELLRHTDSISDGSSRRVPNSLSNLSRDAGRSNPCIARAISDYRNLALIRSRISWSETSGDSTRSHRGRGSPEFSHRYIIQLLETEARRYPAKSGGGRLEMAAERDFENSGLDSWRISPLP